MRQCGPPLLSTLEMFVPLALPAQAVFSANGGTEMNSEFPQSPGCVATGATQQNSGQVDDLTGLG